MEETTGQPQLPGFHQFLAAPVPHLSILDGTGLIFYRETGSAGLLVARGTAFSEAGEL